MSEGQAGGGHSDAGQRSSLDEVVSRLSSGYRSIGDMVYEVLRQAVLSGAFAPGEHLRQEALATAIGVSRLPVRAALIKLDSEGLVEFHPRRGAVVKTLTQEQIAEIYELRKLLECHALRKSMATMAPDKVAGLRRHAEVLDSEAEGERFLEVRVRFYRELYDADHSPKLVELIEELRSSVGRYLLGWRVSGNRAAHHGRHGELIDYVERGDVAKAEEWLRGHLREVSEGVSGILSGERDPSSNPTFSA